MKVINLISGPRNISTALMYSFAQRQDFEVLDEPFYGYYLKHAELTISHPSHSEIIESMDSDEESIVENINRIALEKHVFVKGMAHHFLSDEPYYLADWSNVILIRHPMKLIASFSKVISNPTLADIGIKKASELMTYLRSIGKSPIVLDSDELMINPENYIKKLCDLLDIGYNHTMMSWKKGGIPQDGVWSGHWYKRVHQTTGFKVQQKKPETVPPHLGPLLAEALPFYDSLKPYILKNG
jgi:hypothetical protein